MANPEQVFPNQLALGPGQPGGVNVQLPGGGVMNPAMRDVSVFQDPNMAGTNWPGFGRGGPDQLAATAGPTPSAVAPPVQQAPIEGPVQQIPVQQAQAAPAPAAPAAAVDDPNDLVAFARKQQTEQPAAEIPAATTLPVSKTTAHVPNKPTYEFSVEIVDLDDPGLLTSHNAETYAPTPGYPSQFQPRDRGSQEMVRDVINKRTQFDPDALLNEHHNLTEGVPIVAREGGGLVVESGNGRIMAIKGDPNTYEKYRARMTERAAEYGVTPEQLSGFSRPVLVRVRNTALEGKDRTDFIRVANDSPTTALSESEQAVMDSGRITPEMLSEFARDDIGDVGIDELLDRAHSQNFTREFIQNLPEGEKAQLTTGGRLSQDGKRRLKSAIFARVFGEEGGDVVRRFFQSTERGIQRVQDGITQEMPNMLALHSRVQEGSLPAQYDISSVVSEAMQTVSEIQARGGTGTLQTRIQDHLAQASQFDASAEVDMLIGVMGETSRKPGALRRVLRHYLAKVNDFPDSRATSLEGFEFQPPPRNQLLTEAVTVGSSVDAESAAAMARWRQGAQQGEPNPFLAQGK